MQQLWAQKQRKKNLLTLRKPWKGRQGSPEIPLPPLSTLEWGLGRGESWIHPFQSFRSIACTWATLGSPCLPTSCSITGSRPDLALPLHHQLKGKALWSLNISFSIQIVCGLFTVFTELYRKQIACVTPMLAVWTTPVVIFFVFFFFKLLYKAHNVAVNSAIQDLKAKELQYKKSS